MRISQALKARGVPLQQYFHQGGHGGFGAFFLQNRWFTRYLYGVQNGVENDPKAWIVREGTSQANPTPSTPTTRTRPPRPCPWSCRQAAPRPAG